MTRTPHGYRTHWLRLTNNSPSDVVFRIEPWASEATMPVGATIVVAIMGPAEGDILEVELRDRDITVYGWAGSTITVHHDGKLVMGWDLPVPETPPRKAEL